MRDYLGSVRAIYDISTPANEVEDASEHVLEQSDYYAFGERIEVSGQAFDQANRYRYNGKEQLRFESLNLDPGLTDYGARYYAPAFGRWASPDPLADKYYSVSPYAFCNNNPVNFVDPDGEVVGLAMDVISVGCGVYNLVKNIKAGNTKAAWGDAAGIGVDLVCAMVPGLTVGAGAAKTAGKSLNKIADMTIPSKGAWGLKPFDRGRVIEKTLGGWNSNFPVIDKFDAMSRKVTSVKTLDLNAKSYQSGNAVFNKVKGYIDKLANFKEGKLKDIDIKPEHFDYRQLELAIPKNATNSQLEQLRQLQEYAQQQDVILTIVLAK